MLLTFLRSQRLLLEVEIKARQGYCYNNDQIVEIKVKYKTLDEINRQIAEIEKTGKLEF